MRELALRRRRSRIPWVYLVYSRDRGGPTASATGAETVEADLQVGLTHPSSVLPAQERGHVVGRLELERVIA